jgi:hypothetical protein
MRFTNIVTKSDVADYINEIITERLSAYENILDGVSLEELTNFDVPLLSAQTAEEREDGILLSYKDGKLMEETNLNGGEF